MNVSDSVKTFLAKAGTLGGSVDSGAPKNVSSRHYVEEYMIEYGISEDDVVRTKTNKRFTFGPSKVFESEEVIELPMFLENENGEEVLEKAEVYVVDARIPLLIGYEYLEKQGAVIDVGKKILTFEKSGNKYKIKKTSGGHPFLDFAKPKKTTFVTFKTKDKTKNEMYKRIKYLHRLSGHKLERNMRHMYKTPT